MSSVTTVSKSTLLSILENLRDERVAALLDYAEYLLRKQFEEDAGSEVHRPYESNASKSATSTVTVMEASTAPLYSVHTEAIATGIAD